jgi:hypothetical protein
MSDDFFYDESLGQGDPYDHEGAKERARQMFERLLKDGKLPEMMLRTQFVHHVVRGIRELMGSDGVLELLCAIDNNSDWETEIIAERADVENVMLNKYGAFDDDLWEKVKDTLAWTELHKAIFEASNYWIEKAVDEVVNQH